VFLPKASQAHSFLLFPLLSLAVPNPPAAGVIGANLKVIEPRSCGIEDLAGTLAAAKHLSIGTSIE
jgi:hypothetical protein